MKIVRFQITCSPPKKLWLNTYENLVKICSLVKRKEYNLRSLHISGKLILINQINKKNRKKHNIPYKGSQFIQLLGAPRYKFNLLLTAAI